MRRLSRIETRNPAGAGAQGTAVSAEGKMRCSHKTPPRSTGSWAAWKPVARFLGVALAMAALSAFADVPALPVINTNNVFNVTDYGANSANADNSSAIQSAISAAAAASGGGTVEIPPGTFLSGPITLQSKVNLQIDAGGILRMLPFGTYPSSGANFITASHANDVEISGSGAIDGQGQPWWHAIETNSSIVRPRMIEFSGCNRQLIQDVTLSNSPMFHMAFSGSQGNITVRGVTVFAPASSHNTDACDVSGTNILVENCHISVGDDDFTCGGGTWDVLLTNNTYGTGHGVSVGSYTDGGVSNITVVNCSFTGTDNGIRLKSERGRGGLVQNLHYLNLRMTNVAWPLLIYGYYEYGLGTLTHVDPVFAANVAATNSTPLTSTTPIYHDITFSNIVATAPAGRPPLMIWGLPEAVASNIVFDSVHITSSSTLAPGIYNATGIRFIDCSFDLPAGVKTMQLWNANVIFTNTSPAASTQLYQLDGLTTNGLGNSLAFYNARGSLSNTNAFGDGPLTLSASIFTVNNNLTLFPTTVLNFALGTNASTLNVTGNLKLGGTNNIAAGHGFASGTYRLMNCAGALSGSLPTLGTLPSGYTANFSTNTTGQVNLIVTLIATGPPPAPAKLVATTGSNTITLTWSPVATATSYNVKRSLVSGGENATNATVATTNYTDTQVTNGTTYYYVISAVNGFGESPNSTEASATPRTPTYVVVTTNVLSDDFSNGSTVSSTTPVLPTANSASYEVISSKSWVPTPFAAPGDLGFGLPATSSAVVELQAVIASNAVALVKPGDDVRLTVVFTNTSGLLINATNSYALLSFGLYNSAYNGSRSLPIAGGMEGTLTKSQTGDAYGGVQNWRGYFARMTTNSDQILTRPSQTAGTANNNQDLVSTGTSSSFDSPGASTVGSASSFVQLSEGQPYTDVLTITLVDSGTLGITNSLYAGTGTNGTPLVQYGAEATGDNFLTNAFDSMAVGWRQTHSKTGEIPTTMDVSSITFSGHVTEASSPVPLNPTNLVFRLTGHQLQLSWPADHRGWTLETNAVGLAATNAWFPYPGSASLTNVDIPMAANRTNVFFRLTYQP